MSEDMRSMQGESLLSKERSSCGVRFDVIPPELLRKIAEVFYQGEVRFGENSFYKLDSRKILRGDREPINHAFKHINSYQRGDKEDLEDLEDHIINAICNLIMEWWLRMNVDENTEDEYQ